MGFFDMLPAAPLLRPALSVGCLFDVPSGKYILGLNGESILNSGMTGINSVQGPGNSFKSEIINYLFFTPLAHFKSSAGMPYDTENSMTYDRLNRAMHQHIGLDDIDASDPDNGKIHFTQSADIIGDEWFEVIKDIGKERTKIKSSLMRETPFVDDNGKYISIMEPLLISIDSLSEFKISATQEKVVDENAVGASGAKIQFMNEGLAKTQLITQLPNLAVQCGFYFYMVAHTGQTIDMGGMFAPKPSRLAHSKSGADSKGVPQKWKVINHNLYEIFGAKPLFNGGGAKVPRYPKTAKSKNQESVDLNIVNLVSIRNKNGASGFKFEIIISQSEGLLPNLTMFHYLKENNNYGISGNNTTYHLDLMPDTSIGRTTIRSKISDDLRLCRAIEITAQMHQMEVLWSNLDPALHCSPEVLYTDLKAKGYDWDKLLDTRGYWVFNDEAKDLQPYLSTMDLLNMRASTYHPIWYSEKEMVR